MIEIYCSKCGFQLAVFMHEKLNTLNHVLKSYRYKCPKCGWDLNLKNLKTVEIKPNRNFVSLKSYKLYRKYYAP